MAVFRTPIDKLKEVQEVFRRENIRAESPIANVEAATTAHDFGELNFRGSIHKVPPIPFRHALHVAALSQELRGLAAIEQPTEESIKQTMLVLTALVEEFWEMVEHPPEAENPFLDAEMEEIAEMSSFFSSARTKSRVVARSSVRAPAFYQSTWPTDLHRSRVGIHAGWRMDHRAAGGTSS